MHIVNNVLLELNGILMQWPAKQLTAMFKIVIYALKIMLITVEGVNLDIIKFLAQLEI